jgi:hypothetical protein
MIGAANGLLSNGIHSDEGCNIEAMQNNEGT